MAKKSVSPIITWIFWSILVLGAFLAVTWEYFVAGFAADTSKITWLIVAFFFYGFAASLRVAFHLETEFKSLNAMDADQCVGDANSSDAAAMFDSAMERIRRGERIEVRNLITAYSGKLKAKVDNIAVIAGMLITMGLLGTVVGLIITVTGLDQVLQNSTDFTAMKTGLNRTVSGMGTAFYTTFFGALLGGIVLKVLGAEMRKSASILVADTLRFSELYIAPMFQLKASESLVALEGNINALDTQLGALGNSLGGVIETLDAKQSALESNLDDLLKAITLTNEQAVERTNALAGIVGATIEETTRQADERLSMITSSVEVSNEQANARSNALVSAINQTIEATNRLADERLGSITTAVTSTVEETNRLASERAEAVQESTNESNRLADERLAGLLERLSLMMDETHNTANQRVENLATTISRTTEEANRLADERLQALVNTVESAMQSTHQKADAQLAGLVSNVETSINNSRKDAENRLATKSSDLAGKLNEAASMLSSLVTAEAPAPEAISQPEGE
ncbi:MAG: MotA/TolQ/ExbB proton channel family protein [Pontiella sp.]